MCTFFNCTVRKMQISQQKYRSSRCLRMCLLRSTSDERSAPHTAQLTRVSGAVPLACARRCLWNAFSIVHAYEHNEHRYSSLSYLRKLRKRKDERKHDSVSNSPPVIPTSDSEMCACALRRENLRRDRSRGRGSCR